MLWDNLTASNVRKTMPRNKAIKAYSLSKNALMQKIADSIEDRAKADKKQAIIENSVFTETAKEISVTYNADVSPHELILYFQKPLTEKGFEVDPGITSIPAYNDVSYWTCGDFIINW